MVCWQSNSPHQDGVKMDNQKIKRRRTTGFRCQLPLLVLTSSLVYIHTSYSYTHNYRVRCSIPNKNQAEVFQRCLNGWREDNFQLPLNPPIVLRRGDHETGKGFELIRIPPFGLREAIVDNVKGPDGTLTMVYRVMNPGWLTFPVSKHEGEIVFSPTDNGGTELVWNIHWTPLPFCGGITQFFTELIINQCVKFVVD